MRSDESVVSLTGRPSPNVVVAGGAGCEVHTEYVLSDKGTSYPANDDHSFLMFPEEVIRQILEFALDDQGNDYYSLSRVSKQWKEIVEILEPPVICRLKMRFSGRVPEDQDGELIRDLLTTLSRRNSTLYLPPTNSSTTEPQHWPVLQPKFHVLLLCYIHELTKMPAFVKKLYERSIKFLEIISKRTARKMWKALQMLRSAHLSVNNDGRIHQHHHQVTRAVLAELLVHGSAWAGIADTVIDMISMSTREHIHNRGDVQGIRKRAWSYLSSCLLKEMALTFFLEEVSFTDSQQLTKIWQSVVSLFEKSNIAAQNYHRTRLDRRLLLACVRACETFHILPINESSRMVEETYRSFWNEFKSVKLSLKCTLDVAIQEDEALKSMSTGRQPSRVENNTPSLIFILPDGKHHELPVQGHAYQASGMMRKLHPRAGEEIRISGHIRMFTKPNVLAKALKFYDMDEKAPCPDIARPMLSRNLQDLVGEQYASFLSAMDSDDLQDLAELASFMHWKKLLSLCEAGLFCSFPLEFELLNFSLSVQALARSVENLARSVQRFVHGAQQRGGW